MDHRRGSSNLGEQLLLSCKPDPCDPTTWVIEGKLQINNSATRERVAQPYVLMIVCPCQSSLDSIKIRIAEVILRQLSSYS